MKYEVKESSGNLMMEKSFSFALRIIKLYQHLSEKKKEYVLSKQVLRSGTSIGANPEESRGAQSPRIFRQRFPLHTRKHGRHLTGCVFSSPQNTSRNGSLTVFTQIVKN